MKDGPLRILLIDDKGVKQTIGDALIGIGMINGVDDILFLRPDDSQGMEFGCKLPEGEELDAFDLALVDLELLPMWDREDSRASLIGGSGVLPYFRREAPWLPVIAESRLFRTEAELLLPIALSFGFDGHFPQTDFGNKNFKRSIWDTLMSAARELRRRAAIGDDAYASRKVPLLQPSDNALAILDSEFPGWRDLFVATFCFANKIVIDTLNSGFSGARVFKIVAVNQDIEDLSESEWVMKLSKSPWKLHEELRAHLQMVKYGLDHARMVPLLWNTVVVENRLAAIVYKFAEGTRSSADLIQDIASADTLSARLGMMLSQFYRNKHDDKLLTRELVNNSFRSKSSLEKSLTVLDPTSAIFQLINSLVTDSAHPTLGSIAEYTRCRIHGDLHFGNIMLSGTSPSNDLLIDFANSRMGAISLDGAKLISDLLIRLSDARDVGVPAWEVTSGKLKNIMGGFTPAYEFKNDDHTLFKLFTCLYLAESLAYDDVDDSTKAWIKNALSLVTL